MEPREEGGIALAVDARTLSLSRVLLDLFADLARASDRVSLTGALPIKQRLEVGLATGE